MDHSPKTLRILIVEDEALLVMDIEAMVEEAGHRVIADAASLHDVDRLRLDLPPDLALVDVQLSQGSSGLDVAQLIQQRWSNTFIVFITANPKKIPDDHTGAHGVIAKPFSRDGLTSAIHYIAEGIKDPPPSRPRPPSFTPFPNFPVAN